MMLPSVVTILAEDRSLHWESLREQIRDPGGSVYVRTLPVVLVIAGVVLAVVTGMWLWERWRRRNDGPGPRGVFDLVAGNLGLKFGDQRLLWSIARRQKLVSPLTLVVSHATLDHYAGLYLARVWSVRRRRLAARVAAVRGRLFPLSRGGE